MSKTLKIFVTLVIVVVIVILSRGSTKQDTIKIGFSIPLTGSQATVGEGLKNAALLAQSKLKNTKYNYELVFEDNQFDPKTAVGNANKFVSIDKVSAIIDVYAPIGNVISPIAEENKTTHIGVAFDKKIAEGDYNFILFTTPDTAARTFLAEMNKRGLKKLGIFKVNNQGILSIYEAVNRLSKEYGISIVFDETFQPGERDFKNLIAKSKVNKADIYALLSLSPELEILAKQLKEQGINNQTSVIYFELSQDRSVFEGLWSVGYGKIDDTLAKEYKDKYQKDMTFGVPNVYDAFNLIVRAAESYSEEGIPSSKYIADYIQNMSDTEGALGTLHVDSSGIIDSPAAIKVIKNGVMELVE